MILECPNCATRYEMSAALPEEGRKVRCARCSHIWHAMPNEDISEPEETPDDHHSDDPYDDDKHDILAAAEAETEHVEPPEEIEQVEEIEQAAESETIEDIEPVEQPEDPEDIEQPELTDKIDTEQDDLEIEIIPPIKPDDSDTAELEFRDTEAQANQSKDDHIDIEDWGGVSTQANADIGSTLEDFEITEPTVETVDAPVIDHNEFANEGLNISDQKDADNALNAAKVETKDSDFLLEAENPVEIKGVQPGAADPATIVPPQLQQSASSNFGTAFQKPKSALDKAKSFYKVAAGWIILVLSIASFFGVSYLYRISIVQALPGAVHIYAAVGVDVNIRSLEFKSVVYKPSTNAGKPSIQVSGSIVNISNRNIEIPTVVFVFKDDKGAELYYLARRVDSNVLPATRRLNFSFHLQVPPVEAKTLELRFAREAYL